MTYRIVTHTQRAGKINSGNWPFKEMGSMEREAMKHPHGRTEQVYQSLSPPRSFSGSVYSD